MANKCNPADLFNEGKRPNTLSDDERGKLAESVMGWARDLANRHASIVRETGDQVDADGLFGDALVAIVEASKWFDPRRGTKFTTFCTPYVVQALKQSTDPRRAVRFEGTTCPERSTIDEHDAEERAEPLPLSKRQEILLGALSPSAREVVELVSRQGLSIDQVAEQQGRPVREVQLDLRNAAKTLAVRVVADESSNIFDGLAESRGDLPTEAARAAGEYLASL